MIKILKNKNYSLGGFLNQKFQKFEKKFKKMKILALIATLMHQQTKSD